MPAKRDERMGSFPGQGADTLRDMESKMVDKELLVSPWKV